MTFEPTQENIIKVMVLLGKILAELNPKEQKVVKLRWGIEDGQTKTLEEVGREFGVTRERIRQIEAKAIERIRQHLIK